MMGLCLVSFLDPRHYRYFIGILAFSSVLIIRFVAKNILHVNKELDLSLIILLAALPGYHIMFDQSGNYKRPTTADNINILFDKLHMKDISPRYYPDNIIAQNEFEKNIDKATTAAWDTGIGGVTTLSAFLLPHRPQVGLWHTTVVQWDSYQDKELIKKDLMNNNIEWIMRIENGQLKFLSLTEYAQEATSYDRHPKTLFYNYGFPEELSKINY